VARLSMARAGMARACSGPHFGSFIQKACSQSDLDDAFRCMPTAMPASTVSTKTTVLSRLPAGLMPAADSSMCNAANGSEIAKEALDRISALYSIEAALD
jgi:hypothetical protein